jgi:NitT/TauT family transport system ATP-binding protein
MGGVYVSHLKKSYASAKEGTPITVLEDISFEVQPGEVVTLFGPNGCGKTTLLNCIAGLLPTEAGDIAIDEEGAGEGKVGYIFQDYRQTLLPWFSVQKNLAYPLSLRGAPRVECERRVTSLLGETGISLPLTVFPSQLSGGQQQLLVIARALLYGASVMLFDEPFSALDVNARVRMRSRVQEIWRRTGATVLFVTQELDEALLLADRVIMLSRCPARIMETIPVPFPRPRRAELLETQEFFEIRRHALRIFREALTTCDFTD